MDNPAKAAEALRNARKAKTDSLRPPPYFGDEPPPPSRLLLAVIILAVLVLLAIAASVITQLSLKYIASFVLVAFYLVVQIRMLAWLRRR